jgi:predicted CoA-binding protein
VNPGHKEILGRKCYPALAAVTEHIDIVDIFRRSEDVLPIVEDAIAVGAKVIWMQLGILNHQAAARAEEAGLTVIMNRCIKIDHNDLF